MKNIVQNKYNILLIVLSCQKPISERQSNSVKSLRFLLPIIISFIFDRFVCGFSIGAISAAIPIYISEVAHPSLRGTLSCIIILGVNFGMFIAAFFGKHSI